MAPLRYTHVCMADIV